MKKRIAFFVCVFLLLIIIPFMSAGKGGGGETDYHGSCSNGNCCLLEGGGEYKCDPRLYGVSPQPNGCYSNPCCKRSYCQGLSCVTVNYDNPNTVQAGATCDGNYQCHDDSNCNACLNTPCQLSECQASVVCNPIDSVNRNCVYTNKPSQTPCSIGVCNNSGECCIPKCAGKECGSNSCDGSCGTCPYGNCNSLGKCVNDVYFLNMAGAKINSTSLNSMVKLALFGHDLKGKEIQYDLEKKDLASTQILAGSVLGQENSTGYLAWRANVSGKFYFKARVNGTVVTSWFNTEDNSNPFKYLNVSNSETNSKPVAKIENPKKGEIYKTGEVVNFNQSSYDLDDFMNYSWDLDDLTIVKGSTRDYVNYNITHIYGVDGEKNINLSVVDSRGLSDQDMVSILVYNPDSFGKRYVFAGISKPNYKEIITIIGNAEFNANDSYAVEVNASGGLTCIGGNCPASVSDPSGKKGDYSMFNFTWTFDDGNIASTNNLTYSRPFSIGDHNARLEAFINSGESGKTITIFTYNGGSSNMCGTDGTTWSESGIVYPTLQPNNKCKGADGVAGTNSSGTSDDCCPQDYTCQMNNSASSYQCMVNATCLSIPSCGSYNDSASCNNDTNNCKVASRSCSISSAGTDVCGTSIGGTVGGSCRCQWNGSSCYLNKTTSITVGSISLKGNCVTDKISVGECSSGQMIVTQHSNMSWENLSVLINSIPGVTITNQDQAQAWVNTNCKISSCFSGTKVMACDDNSIRLEFFNWLNAIVAVIIIIVIYLVWFKCKKVKRRNHKKGKLRLVIYL